MKRLFLIISASFLFGAVADAQENAGYLTGSLETNNHYYLDDKSVGTAVDGDRFASNNYLKLDYYKGNFSAGMQLEGYLPAIVGYNTEEYPSILSGMDLSNFYASWKDDSFSVTVGTFYDQFGSGLLFRSWEDRALGINNAVLGARATYNYKDILSLKALWGLPRFGMGLFTAGGSADRNLFNSATHVRGADLSFAVSNLCGWNDLYLAVEGSVLSRFEPMANQILKSEGAQESTLGWSARANVEYSGFFLKGEYVDAGWMYFGIPDYDWTDSGSNKYTGKKGNAVLVDMGYNGRGLGVTLTARRLEYMSSHIFEDPDNGGLRALVGNTLNYIPALCTQYTYMLTNLHPYTAFTPSILSADNRTSGEMGFQLDAFYNFRRGTVIGGKRGMKIHANFSTYYGIARQYTMQPGDMLFRDFSFDVERQWTKKFKMLLMYSYQKYGNQRLQNIFVADLLYKFTDRLSTRLELQYLSTRQDEKDWMAVLAEVNFAPNWSVFASDMYNHGSSLTHYYNFGVSYSKSRTRVALGYGRYKDGYICSGGVCRRIPAYTGANLTITTSF